MTTEERKIVAQRQQLGHDRPDQRGGVAIGEIRTPHRTLKQHVANEQKPSGVVDVDEVAGGVAGAVEDVEPVLTQHDRLAFAQPAIGGDIIRLEPIAGGLGGDAVEQEFVANVRPLDRALQGRRQSRRATGVVQMVIRGGEQAFSVWPVSNTEDRLWMLGAMMSVERTQILPLMCRAAR